MLLCERIIHARSHVRAFACPIYFFSQFHDVGVSVQKIYTHRGTIVNYQVYIVKLSSSVVFIIQNKYIIGDSAFMCQANAQVYKGLLKRIVIILKNTLFIIMKCQIIFIRTEKEIKCRKQPPRQSIKPK